MQNDLSGKSFGKITVISRAENKIRSNGWVRAVWNCKCECGTEAKILGDSLISGKTTSCGCVRRARSTEMSTKHGFHGTRLYNIWLDMKKRCSNFKRSDYKHYGGRGISVHPSWAESFEQFKSDAEAGYSDDLTLDRIDTNGNYEPGNTRWASRKTQAKNRRNSRIVELNGVAMCVRDWERALGLSVGRIHSRMFRKNETPNDAVKFYAMKSE